MFRKKDPETEAPGTGEGGFRRPLGDAAKPAPQPELRRKVEFSTGSPGGASETGAGLSGAHADPDRYGKRLIVGKGIKLSGEISSCDRLVVEGEVEVTLNDTLALEIASAAARLVVEEGLEYGAAKHKAARRVRRSGHAEMPSNEQVEDEVRQHLELFCAETQPAELLALRRLALRWMERLLQDAGPLVQLPGANGALSLQTMCEGAVSWQQLEELERAGARGLMVLAVERSLA